MTGMNIVLYVLMTAYFLQILGVPPGSSEKELRSAYTQLVKKYHPNKVSDPEQKIVQQDKFIVIQRAFDAVSSIRQGRIRAKKVDLEERDYCRV